jgi:hypothetical protein
MSSGKGARLLRSRYRYKSKHEGKVDKLMDAGALVSNGGGLREATAIVAGANLLIGAASTFSWYLGIRTRAKCWQYQSLTVKTLRETTLEAGYRVRAPRS